VTKGRKEEGVDKLLDVVGGQGEGRVVSDNEGEMRGRGNP
jgi:hypothetical protein